MNAVALLHLGYFLTPEMVTRLLPFGLDGAQVTLDGDHTTHSLTRVSKRGESPLEIQTSILSGAVDAIQARNRRVPVDVVTVCRTAMRRYP